MVAVANGLKLVEKVKRKRREEPILIPQFACANCGHCLYLESDRVLFFQGKISKEIKRLVGVLRWDGQMSLRNIQVCVLKIFGLRLSLGFIYEDVKRTCKKARKINEKIRGLVNLMHVVADEVWIRVKSPSKKWTYGFLNYG